MSYFVSLHEDMRDAIEIESASGHDHAADIAVQMGLPWPDWIDGVYVVHNGDMRVVSFPAIEEIDPDEDGRDGREGGGGRRMKTIIGIDPGNTHTAIVVTKGGKIAEAHYLPNREAANWLMALTGGPPLLAKLREALQGAEVLANCLAKALFVGREAIRSAFPGNNDNVLAIQDALLLLPPAPSEPVEVVCEMIASYGMAVGQTVFETCAFIGAIRQIYPAAKFITRLQVKSAVCHSAKANDANIRQALIDRYGAPGTKKNPGQTYGISGDMWAALAVATAYEDGAKLYEFTA